MYFYVMKKLVLLINLKGYSGQWLLILFLKVVFLKEIIAISRFLAKKKKKRQGWKPRMGFQLHFKNCSAKYTVLPIFNAKTWVIVMFGNPGPLNEDLPRWSYWDPCIAVPAGGSPFNQTKKQGSLETAEGTRHTPAWRGIPGLARPHQIELCQEVIIFNTIQK